MILLPTLLFYVCTVWCGVEERECEYMKEEKREGKREKRNVV